MPSLRMADTEGEKGVGGTPFWVLTAWSSSYQVNIGYRRVKCPPHVLGISSCRGRGECQLWNNCPFRRGLLRLRVPLVGGVPYPCFLGDFWLCTAQRSLARYLRRLPLELHQFILPTATLRPTAPRILVLSPIAHPSRRIHSSRG
jgi:hypothetical protein